MPGPQRNTHSQSYIPPSSITGGHNRFLLFWGEVKIPLLIVLGLLSVSLGVLGFERYFTQVGSAHNFGRSLYDALGLLEFKGGDLPTPLPWELEVARWLSPAVTMYAVLLGLVALFRNQIRIIRLRFGAGHVIICGLGQKGLLLAKTFHASGQTVAVIESDANNPFLPICRDLGVVVLPGDARDAFTLQKAGVKHAKSLIAVCGEDGTNADIAAKARKLISRRKGRKLECAIHIKDPQLWQFLRKQEMYDSQKEAFRLDIFNIYDHGARQLLREYPLLPRTNGLQERSPHLIIVGLGNLGEQIVLHAARQWHPHFDGKGGKLTFSVIDPQARRKVAVLCRKYSLVEKICEWDLP